MGFDPWPVRFLGQSLSYHKRFCRARFRVICVSGEEPVEIGKSPAGRNSRRGYTPGTWRERTAQWAPGSLPQATLRTAQLLASSIHWWEGWVGLLVPSQTVPQSLPVGGLRAKCVSDAGGKCLCIWTMSLAQDPVEQEIP